MQDFECAAALAEPDCLCGDKFAAGMEELEGRGGSGGKVGKKAAEFI